MIRTVLWHTAEFIAATCILGSPFAFLYLGCGFGYTCP